MKVLKVLTFVFTGLFAVFFFVKDRIVINPTASMPIGIYWRYDKPVLERGDIVLACLPDSRESRLFIDRGYLYGVSCPGGHGKILKTIKGIPARIPVGIGPINEFPPVTEKSIPAETIPFIPPCAKAAGIQLPVRRVR